MKGIGNYRQLPPRETMERRAGTLYEIQGDRARVRWLDGQLGALPLAPFRTLSIAPGDPFVLVTVYRGSQVASVRIERSGTRPAVIDRPLPKVVMRDGIKLTTRR